MYLTKDKQEKLIEMTEQISKGFKMQLSYYHQFTAINALKVEKEIDVINIKSVMDFIRRNTSMMSSFRTINFMMASLLCLHHEHPEDVFMRIKEHSELFKKAGFKQTQYLPMTAYCLDSLLYDSKIQDMAIQTRSYKESLITKSVETYTHMKQQHPWLTGGDDYSLCVLLAHSHKSLDRVEDIYQQLHQFGLARSNGLQSLANILALSSEEVSVLVERLIQTKEYFKSEGMKFNEYAYPGLGMLVHLNYDQEKLAEVVEMIHTLRSMKHFKWLDKSMLLLFSILLISEEHKQEMAGKTIFETTIQITIEQIITAQIAVMVAIMSSSAATSAAT